MAERQHKAVEFSAKQEYLLKRMNHRKYETFLQELLRSHNLTTTALHTTIPLPWGGRGRKFKSCHSDQNRRFNRTSEFSLFYGLFRACWCLHRLENVRYFFAQNRLKIGYDQMFDHICHEKAIYYKGFRHFSIFILCKMTAVLCS